MNTISVAPESHGPCAALNKKEIIQVCTHVMVHRGMRMGYIRTISEAIGKSGRWHTQDTTLCKDTSHPNTFSGSMFGCAGMCGSCPVTVQFACVMHIGTYAAIQIDMVDVITWVVAVGAAVP